MTTLLTLLILAALPSAPTEAPAALPGAADQTVRIESKEPPSPAPMPAVAAPSIQLPEHAANSARNPDAVEVFRSDFEDANDRDFDGWPDGWQRKRGQQFPWYLEIGLDRTPSPSGSQALRIKLNGAAGAVMSPDLPVRSLFSYVAEGYVKTEGLNHDRARMVVTFYDAAGKEVESFKSEPIVKAPDWQRVVLGPMAPASQAIDHAVIMLELLPGAQADLQGSAWFDNIWLGRLPRMTLHTNRSFNVYTDPEDLEVACKVSGIFERDPLIRFVVRDIEGRDIVSHEHRLAGVADKNTDNDDAEVGYTGDLSWKPAIKDPGFYRLHCALKGREGLELIREQSLVIVEPTENPPQGEYGWSLPHGEHPLSLASLEKLLPQMGINWVKLPLWVSDVDSRRLDQLVAFAERMSARGIETVGLLSEPPAEARAQFGDSTQLLAADMFSTEPELWYPLLEPVMARLSLQVRWWQLGLDNDVSFVGYQNLTATITRIKAELQRFGQEVNLGFGWRIFDEQLPAVNPPWDFLALTASPQLTAAEVTQYLAALDGKRSRRWLTIEPLSKRHYALDTRASDLVNRMLAAKMAGAEGVFIADPFNDDHGLMQSDGTPGELLMPWRSTALVLAGSEYLGSLQLPEGSHNHIFKRDGQVMMVVWNNRPVTETIYLGEDLRVTDVWGRKSTPQRKDQASAINITRTPSFLTGVSESIVRWNMSFQFTHTALPSVFGVTHDNAFTLKNAFNQGVSAKARLMVPDTWKIAPRTIDFKMAAGEETVQSFGIALPYDASSGRQPIRIDFEVNADQRYAFSVYRHLDIGQDDVVLDVTTRMNTAGELEVEQVVVNKTDTSVSFKCLLFVPDRRRLMSQVIRLGNDRDRKLYRLPDGKELLGKTLWIRAEEINGNRTLNRRFVAEE